MSKLCLTIVAGALIALYAAPASAQTSGIRIGRLTCNTGPSVGLIIGSRQNLRCVFRSARSGKRYYYSGTMTRFGLDLGVSAAGRLFWTVFARTMHVGHGALRGTYVGVSGDLSAGFGIGANFLVGGSERTITLQPLSVEAQLGVNLAFGVASLSLR